MTGYPLHLKIINDKKWIPLTHKYDVITEWRKRLKRHESKYITTHKAKNHHPKKNAFKVALPCVIALFWLLTEQGLDVQCSFGHESMRRVIQVIYTQNSRIRGQCISSPILFIIFFFFWMACSIELRCFDTIFRNTALRLFQSPKEEAFPMLDRHHFFTKNCFRIGVSYAGILFNNIDIRMTSIKQNVEFQIVKLEFCTI